MRTMATVEVSLAVPLWFELINAMMHVGISAALPVTAKGCQCLSECKICSSYHSVRPQSHLHCCAVFAVMAVTTTCANTSEALYVALL